jgi:type VI secretion system protein ImpM
VLSNSSGSMPDASGLSFDSGDLSDLISDATQGSDAAPDAAIAADLLDAWREFDAQPGAWCLWWTAGATRIIATRGLPSSYSVLLDESSTGGESASQAIECEHQDEDDASSMRPDSSLQSVTHPAASAHDDPAIARTRPIEPEEDRS